jgi:catechol 2,3-dioxygenase-like lactoylglutathione lyase family enzyme
MTRTEISAISPCFVVRHVPTSLAFYRDRLGFKVTYEGPEPDDIFFGIVGRGGAQILVKAAGVDPVPNHTRDVKQGVMRWDAFVYVPDPDALAEEFASRNVEFFEPEGHA